MSERVSSDAVIDLSYHPDCDYYFLRAKGKPVSEVAGTSISPLGGFLLFDNQSYGRMIAAGFQATDEEALSIMDDLFEPDFRFTAESMREGTQVYNPGERKAQMFVPYSNRRRLAMIAFHAMAINAADHVKQRAARIREILAASAADESVA